MARAVFHLNHPDDGVGGFLEFLGSWRSLLDNNATTVRWRATVFLPGNAQRLVVETEESLTTRRHAQLSQGTWEINGVPFRLHEPHDDEDRNICEELIDDNFGGEPTK